MLIKEVIDELIKPSLEDTKEVKAQKEIVKSNSKLMGLHFGVEVRNVLEKIRMQAVKDVSREQDLKEEEKRELQYALEKYNKKTLEKNDKDFKRVLECEKKIRDEVNKLNFIKLYESALIEANTFMNSFSINRPKLQKEQDKAITYS